MAPLQTVSFPGALLQRGFWLYVWKVTAVDGKTVLYVGRTGDSSSLNAQSPYNRMGQHLGTQKNINALRRYLNEHEISPESCIDFQFIAHGPIHPEPGRLDETLHLQYRDKVAALEKKLRDALVDAGYSVMNKINSNRPLDEVKWQEVLTAFVEQFPDLQM